MLLFNRRSGKTSRPEVGGHQVGSFRNERGVRALAIGFRKCLWRKEAWRTTRITGNLKMKIIDFNAIRTPPFPIASIIVARIPNR